MLADTADPESRMFERDMREFRGNTQMIQRMRLAETLRKMTPEQRADYKAKQAQYARERAAAKAFINTFKNTNVATLTKARTNPAIEKLRALVLDDYNKDQWVNFFRALPMRSITNLPISKFRFNWGANGRPVYVAWTSASWQNYLKHEQRGRWIPNRPFSHKCSPAWEDKWVKIYTDKSAKWARKYRNTDSRHVMPHKAGASICKKKKKSLWMKIRKVVVGAVLVVAAVYLGPIVLAKAKAVAGGIVGGKAGAAGGAVAAGGGGSSAVAAATTSQKILSGAKTLIGYVNKARTVQAIVKGKMPPPPIGIGGATFGQWAMIVAKEEIKKAAMDKAMEEGVKYIEKKMTKKEEDKIRAEIAELQRQIDATIPPEVKKLPPEPMPELAAPIKKIQQIEIERASNLQQYIIPGAIVAGALILGG